LIWSQLENIKSLLNVGAGSGSYEPPHIPTLAVEPSESMRAVRLKLGCTEALNALAEELPFKQKEFEATMALLTMHHWRDPVSGLLELKRVTSQKILIMTFDPDEFDKLWNAQYFPELIDLEKSRFMNLDRIIQTMDLPCSVYPVPIYAGCKDGFMDAFYNNPEAFLNPKVRLNQSCWGFLDDGMENVLIERLEKELKSGEWDQKFGAFRAMPKYEGALKLLVFEK
jgi:SAM-dependent methyltransferase